MKVKNIKVGVRVVSKVDSQYGVQVGDVGTVLEDDRATPYVKWDRTDANYTNFQGVPCTAISHDDLRKYKDKL